MRSIIFNRTKIAISICLRKLVFIGIGHQFDVVDVDRKLARADLLPTRKAVYASPFDLQYYARIKEVHLR